MERAHNEQETGGEQSRAAVARSAASASRPPIPGGAGVSNRSVARLLGDAARSPGEPLPSSLATSIGGALGADLSGVRVHQGESSGQAATELGAHAFTVGQDIHFAPGRYDPGSSAGMHLLRHEAAHTVQQGPARVADPAALPISRPHDAAEIQAETFAATGTAAALAAEPAGRGTPSRLTHGATIHRSTGVESTAQVSHTPQNEDRAIAVWDSTLSSTIRTTSMVGSLYNAMFVEGAEKEMGHYSTEDAAIAAIRTYGSVGAVFLENGRYVAYHATDDSLVYDLSWDNVRWVERKPWTAVRFTSSAVAILTTDGVVLRPQMYTSEDDAEARLADQALMPGANNPFKGYLELQGDFNKLGKDEFLKAFELAMHDHALAVLSRSHAAVSREVARRAPWMPDNIPAEEVALMRSTVAYLAGIDQEMDDIPKTTPWSLDELAQNGVNQARFQRLKARREVVEARYPLLKRVNAREFVKLPVEQQNNLIRNEAIDVLADIDKTRDNIIERDLDLWTLRPVVESSLAALGITDKDRRDWAIAKHDAERDEDTMISIALSVFSIGFALAGFFVGGPVGAAFAAGALGLGAADAIMLTEDHYAKAAAANTAMDPDQSLVPPDLVDHWGWLVVAWVGVVADAADVIRAVRAVKSATTIGAGIDVLAGADAALAKRLRLAAGEVADGETISEATRATVGNRVGASIEIQESLGAEIRVHYTVTSTGDVVVDGIRCGARATVVDILAHAEVIRLLRRYEGITGKLRHLLDRLLSMGGFTMFGMRPPFPPGSAAFESWLELSKLPTIIEGRRAALGQSLGTESEAALRRDVEFLEAEYQRHVDVVDQMTIEKGAGFIARAQERTAEAIAAGMPALAGNPMITDASRYYYRSNPAGNPPYILCRISTADVPPRTLAPDGGGGWVIVEGGMSRAERAAAMVTGWPPGVRDAFAAFQAAHAGVRVVPLQGVAATGRTIGQLAPDLGERLRVLLQEAYTRIGDPLAANKAIEGAEAVTSHQLVVVRGTDQLRAHNYRLNFTGAADELAEVDLHHIIPLQLGGDHRRLVAVHQDLHDRLHDMIDEIPFGEGTLAPHSIRSSADLSFAEGAAVLNANGSVQLARMNPDGTYTLVP